MKSKYRVIVATHKSGTILNNLVVEALHSTNALIEALALSIEDVSSNVNPPMPPATTEQIMAAAGLEERKKENAV